MDKGRYKQVFRARLSGMLAAHRARLGISQAKMAQRLRITLRAYTDLENGRSNFSAWSLLFFMIALPDEDVCQLLRALRQDVAGAGHEAA